MRPLLAVLAGCLLATSLVAGCASFTVGPADTSSQSELDKRASKACEDIPNTDEALECRRRQQDSWQGPPKGSTTTWPPR
jgi:hypothetical protein